MDKETASDNYDIRKKSNFTQQSIDPFSSTSITNHISSNKEGFFVSSSNNNNTFYDEQFEVNDESSVETTNSRRSEEESQTKNNNMLLSTSHNTEETIRKQNKQRLDAIPKPDDDENPHYNDANDDESDDSVSFSNTRKSSSSFGKKEVQSSDEDVGDNPTTMKHQDLPPELIALFKSVNQYKPKHIKIQPQLKCFIPSYIPSIGDVDPFIKVPRPDNEPDGLGIQVIDEPSTKQSDVAVLELQLKAQLKKKMRRNGGGGGGGAGIGSSSSLSLSATPIRSIENASKNTSEIDKWIDSVQELHISRPVSTTTGEVHFKNPSIIPTMEELMQPFPKELCNELKSLIDEGYGEESNKEYSFFLDPSMDLTLEEYVKVLCTLLDVPVVEGNLVQSLYLIFNLSLEYHKDVNGDAVSIL